MAKPRKNYARKETVYADTGSGLVAVGVKFKFANGHVIETRCDEFPAAIRAEAEAHGFKQKFGDSYNKANSINEAIASAVKLIDSVKGGDWRQSGGGAGIADVYILKAVCEVKGKTMEEVEAIWEGLPEKEKANIRTLENIRPVAERIRAEEKIASAPATTTDALDVFGA